MLNAALALSVLLAQDPKPGQAHPKVDQKRVDDAIDRGARWLLQQRDLSMAHNMTTDLAYDELVLYTLIHAGVDPGDERYKQLLDTAATATLKRTYRASLAAMALEAIDRAKYQNRIADCAQFLADNQCANGQWDYGAETKLPERPKRPEDVATGGGAPSPAPKPPGSKTLSRVRIVQKRPGPPSGDNSNSQYAALGIRACVGANVEFEPKIVQKAAEWWEACQCKTGAWGYCQKGQYTHGDLVVLDDGGHGAMTAGGIASVCIYRWILKQDYKRDKAVAEARTWMAKNLAFTDNPGARNPRQWIYYWIYAIERAGMIYGTEKFGPHEWYPEGANWLLDQQKPGGAWVSPENNPVGDTCFAILFLRRATKPLPKIATGK